MYSVKDSAREKVNAFDGVCNSVCVKGIWIKRKMLVKRDWVLFAILKSIGSARRKLSNCANLYSSNNMWRRINAEMLGNDCSAEAV